MASMASCLHMYSLDEKRKNRCDRIEGRSGNVVGKEMGNDLRFDDKVD